MSDEKPSDEKATGKPPKKGGLLKRLMMFGLVGFVILAGVVFVAHNALIRSGLEKAVTDSTGFPLTIDRFHLGLGDSRIEIGDLRLSNPEDFPDPRCIHVSSFVADVELASLRTDEPHIEELTLMVEEVVVVKQENGSTNLDRLKSLGGSGKEKKEKKPDDEPSGESGEKDEKEPLKFKCDLLKLKIGKVRLLNYAKMKDGKPKEKVFELGVDEEFRDITDVKQVTRIIAWQVVKGSPIRLGNTALDSIKSGLGGVLSGTGEAISDAAGAIGGAASGIGKSIGNLFGGGDDDKDE
ncbi:MAG: DUF748 domain-containing protein [Planctomycetota bacterium]|jgi:hypothetical protein